MGGGRGGGQGCSGLQKEGETPEPGKDRGERLRRKTAGSKLHSEKITQQTEGQALRQEDVGCRQGTRRHTRGVRHRPGENQEV